MKDTNQSENIRSEDVSAMLHDLKTPLATISGYIQLATSKIPSQDSSKKWMTEALNEVEKMTGMINTMSERIKSR